MKILARVAVFLLSCVVSVWFRTGVDACFCGAQALLIFLSCLVTEQLAFSICLSSVVVSSHLAGYGIIFHRDVIFGY